MGYGPVPGIRQRAPQKCIKTALGATLVLRILMARAVLLLIMRDTPTFFEGEADVP
jgi:hypothetical protein